MLDDDATSATILTLVLQVVIKMADHVLDRLVASFRIKGVLDRLGSFHEVVDVDSGSVAAYAPDDAGKVEEKRLDKENDGDPLVVADV